MKHLLINKRWWVILPLWGVVTAAMAQKRLHVVDEQAKALTEQAVEYMLTNPKQASYYAMQAASLYTDNHPNAVRAEAMILYCQAEQLLGNFDLSIKSIYDAQRFIPAKNRRLHANLYALQGRIYGKLGDYNKAIDLNDKATSIYKALGDSLSIASCYNERGVIHHLAGEQLIADRFFRRALAINRAQRNLRAIASNLNNLCLYEGDTEEKLTLLQEAMVINKNMGSRWSLGENYNNMGKQYFYARRYTEALASLQTAYELANSIGARELICDNYEYRAMVFAAMKDYTHAYDNLKKMYEMRIELQSNNKLRNIEQEISYKRYQDQKRDNERKEQEYRIELLKRNVWILLILMGLGLALSVTLYLWYKRRKRVELMEARYRLQLSQHELNELKMKQQEQELEAAHHELESSRHEMTHIAVFLQSRHELLDKIRGLIKEGYRMDQEELLPHLKCINAFIAQSQGGDAVGNHLIATIEEKNQAFKQRLLALHASLTPGELHLSMLLRVNLTTKEIAMLTGNTVKTIHMNRYRLRKSLALSADEDLVEYLRRL